VCVSRETVATRKNPTQATESAFRSYTKLHKPHQPAQSAPLKGRSNLRKPTNWKKGVVWQTETPTEECSTTTTMRRSDLRKLVFFRVVWTEIGDEILGRNRLRNYAKNCPRDGIRNFGWRAAETPRARDKAKRALQKECYDRISEHSLSCAGPQSFQWRAAASGSPPRAHPTRTRFCIYSSKHIWISTLTWSISSSSLLRWKYAPMPTFVFSINRDESVDPHCCTHLDSVPLQADYCDAGFAGQKKTLGAKRKGVRA